MENALTSQDRQDITDSLAQYAHTYDSRDIDRFCNLFNSDGVVAYYFEGKLSSETAQEKRGDIRKIRFKAFEQRGIAQTRHFITNIVLEPQDNGTVFARSWFFVTHQYRDEPAPRPVHSGEYRDTFEKTSSGWKILRHEIHIDHNQG